MPAIALVPLLKSALISIGIGVPISTAFRYFTEGPEKAFDIREIATDVIVSGVFGGITPLFSRFAPLTTNVLKGAAKAAMIDAPLAMSALFTRDVVEDIVKGEEIKLEYRPEHYIGAGILGAGLGALSWTLAKKIAEGKIPVYKLGVVRNPAGRETWIGVYREQHGHPVQQVAGMMIRHEPGKVLPQIQFGRKLEFSKFHPDLTPLKSPIEINLSFNAIKNYYDELTAQGKVSGKLGAKSFELMFDVLNEIQKLPSEVVKMDLKELLIQSDRLRDLTPEELNKFYEILLKYLRSEKAFLYGSLSMKKFMGKEFKREIGDVDVQMIGGSADEFVDDLKRAGLDKKLVFEKTDEGYKILNKYGEKVMEIFNYQMSPDSYIGYGFRPQPLQETKSGLVMQLKESAARKFVSSYTPRETGFWPEPGREKDIVDLVSTLKYYAKQYPQLRPKINAALNALKKEGFKELVENAPAELKIIIGKPTQQTTPNLPSVPVSPSSPSSVAVTSSPSKAAEIPTSKAAEISASKVAEISSSKAAQISSKSSSPSSKSSSSSSVSSSQSSPSPIPSSSSSYIKEEGSTPSSSASRPYSYSYYYVPPMSSSSSSVVSSFPTTLINPIDEERTPFFLVPLFKPVTLGTPTGGHLNYKTMVVSELDYI